LFLNIHTKTVNSAVSFPGTEGAREYSETTDRLIDTDAEKIINKQYLIALEILREKKNVLVKAAKLLLKK